MVAPAARSDFPPPRFARATAARRCASASARSTRAEKFAALGEDDILWSLCDRLAGLAEAIDAQRDDVLQRVHGVP
jgi:hypothetical protein